MGGALDASASLGGAGVAWPRAALAKTANTKAVPIRIIQCSQLELGLD
jgi:hypothetical protein